ncbi:MAG TPA: aminotransferase class V-fold PLP-dependent enzyme [Thermoanaerobaculia bacterium]|jgi:glutamate/tyrosine decarboxylase-like PLP-dependent enzyme|nr:aminotransferase class V-fold PLP-dependent enzyme [Thermoanaerobaculia bacterium]
MPLEIYDEAILRRAFHHASTFLRALPNRPVAPSAPRDELMRALNVPLTDDGDDPAAVLDSLAAAAERGTMATAGPRFFGFVIGASLPVTVATDWMLSAWDQNTGIYAASPLVSVIEDIARDWLLDLLRLPREASAGFTTGGQMSNFTCLAAARHAVLRNAGWNVEEQGLQGAPRINVIVTDEAHITIFVALRYLGLGTSAIHIPTDEQGRMRADELRATLQKLSGPTIVCAQAGNVNTGSFDPLREIGEVTRERGAWLHVDGAFGLWAAASRRKRPLIDGAELADSWATDAHKWLNVPYDCGVAIVRDSAAHRASMTSSAAYLEQTSGKERDSLDWVPEFSRRGRGVTVYAALRTLGRLGVEDLVDRLCDRARQIAELLARDDRVQILNDVVLNQVLLRFGSDQRTREVIARVQQDGTCWLGGTTWHGLAAMRISISGWATTEEDIERSAEAILRSLTPR